MPNRNNFITYCCIRRKKICVLGGSTTPPGRKFLIQENSAPQPMRNAGLPLDDGKQPATAGVDPLDFQGHREEIKEVPVQNLRAIRKLDQQGVLA